MIIEVQQNSNIINEKKFLKEHNIEDFTKINKRRQQQLIKGCIYRAEPRRKLLFTTESGTGKFN